MNKTLLLILCDFLLLNLLALTNWQTAEPITPKQVTTPVTINPSDTNPATKDDDLVDLMRQSLADEQQQRQQLADELNRQLQQKDDSLRQKEEAIAATREQLSQKTTELTTALTAEQQRAAELARQAAVLSRQTEQLASQQTASRQAAELTRQQLAQLRSDLALQAAENQRKQQQIQELETQQTAAREQIQNLSVAVKVAEHEKTILRQTTQTLQEQIVAEQADRRLSQNATLQLAQGLTQTSSSLGQLHQTLVENRPRTPNEIYDAYIQKHRIQIRIQTSRVGRNTSSTVNAILLSDPINADSHHAIFLATDTAIDPAKTPQSWLYINADIQKPDAGYYAPTLAFVYLSGDPRILALPLEKGRYENLHAESYKIAADPLRTTEAILINTAGKGYGKAAFSIDTQLPDELRNRYLRMDTSLFKRLFGDFAPATGDIVISETGDLIGIMVNNAYCALIDNLFPAQTITAGPQSPDEINERLRSLAHRLKQFPPRLQ